MILTQLCYVGPLNKNIRSLSNSKLLCPQHEKKTDTNLDEMYNRNCNDRPFSVF